MSHDLISGSSLSRRKFLLLEDRVGRKHQAGPKLSHVSGRTLHDAEVELPRGTILEEASRETNSAPSVTLALNLKSLDHVDVVISCFEPELKPLTNLDADVLLPVIPVRERIRVLSDTRWMKEASLLQEGVDVNVIVTDDQPSVDGVVRYRGPVPELGKGLYFGVELLNCRDENAGDGSIKGKQYFQAPNGTALFVTINKIRLSLRGLLSRTAELDLIASKPGIFNTPVTSFVAKHPPLSLEVVCADGTPPPPLKIGDRVVWISDTGPEYGVVKWLGKLLDVGSDWMIGVEFDNPVGTGTGKYNDCQLFEAKLNHASLVPIIGLMKAEDFSGSQAAQAVPSVGTSVLPYDGLQKSSGPLHATENIPSATSGSFSPYSKSKQLIQVPTQVVHQRSSSAAEATLPPNACDDKSKRRSSSLSAMADKGKVSDLVAGLYNQGSMVAGAVGANLRPSDLIVPSTSDENFLLSSRPLTKTTMAGCKSVLVGPDVIDGHAAIDDAFCDTSPLNLDSCGSYYHVVRDECFGMGTNPSVNPLYEMFGRKGVSTSKVGITRIDDTNDTQIQNVTNSMHSTSNGKKTSSSKVGCCKYSSDLEVGSVVEVMVNGVPRYGVIRWIGTIPEEQNNNSCKPVAGIEMEEEGTGCTDGTFNGRRYFHCPSHKAFFVRLSQCRKDGRFTELEKRRSLGTLDTFGSIDCPSIVGEVPPLSTAEDLRLLCGKFRGIQGHHNSCYLDTTLFVMFSCTSVFDSLLYRPPGLDDIPQYREVQRVLREEIVNPLRANLYVRADRVMKLRKLLDELSSVEGLTCEEKDPEEFLNSLLNQILKAEPFLKLSSGQESYLYQLFVEKDDKLPLPTVQQLFNQSFLMSDIKLREVPPCLLIQMPRFGNQFKVYPRIIPSQYLDITDVLDDSPRQCSVCGQVAEYECKECFGQFGEGLDSTAFCQKCMDTSHSHKKRSRHQNTKLSIPPEFSMLKDHTPVPRVYMELFAVVCIATSHYVCFVKCGNGPDAPWCFFDSMADRKGEQNGYNIPEVTSFPDLRWWLSEEGINVLLTTKDDKVLPEIARRLFCDAYLCLYQSPDIMMYR